MITLLANLWLVGASIYRPPTGVYPVLSKTEKVWVYFTDKGFQTQAEMAPALATLSQALSPLVRQRRLEAMGQEADFDDIPVYQPYLDRVEALGARLVAKSAWLNAASFRMPPEVVARVAALPFVHRVTLVNSVWEPTGEAVYPVAPEALETRGRGEDTLGYKEIYGFAYAQNQMLGVPAAYALGVTGAGVRIGLLDTGLKRRHPAVSGIKVLAEHDFLSGDQLALAQASGLEDARRPGVLKGIGLAESPAAFCSGDTIYVCYIADTVRGDYPVRGVFVTVSFDRGASWTVPQGLFVPDFASLSAHRVSVAGRPGEVYVTWQTASRAEENPQVWFGYFSNGAWNGASLIQAGISPNIFLRGDSLFLCALGPDSTLWFNSALLGAAGPVWGQPRLCASLDELVRDPWIVVDEARRIVIATTGWRTGKVYLFESSDQGRSFSQAPSPVTADAEAARLWYTPGRYALLLRDFSRRPLHDLVLLHSSDCRQWTRSVVAESLLTSGGLALSDSAGELRVAFECSGVLAVRRSSDLVNWSRVSRLSTSGFSHSPTWLGTSQLLWVENGDDNTDYDSTEAKRFGYNQADHGTRMASIIAGYHRGSMVGVAPGVELLVAKTEYHSFRSDRIGYELLLEEDTYIAGLEWAERNGADIVSSSLGYRSWYGNQDMDGKTAPISVAAARAVDRGLIVVTAMGNRDTTNSAYRWPNPYIVAPGDAFGVITVGGVQKSGKPWHTPGGGGTGCGPTADGRHKPDLVAMSDSLIVVVPDSTTNYYEGSSGTSGATALVAGCCALLKQAYPDWSSTQIRDTLLRYASKNQTPDDTFGWGIPNVSAILRKHPPTIHLYVQDGLDAPFPNPYVAGTNHLVYFPIVLVQKASYARLRIYTLDGELV
ncbi:MAG: S8 family serine peptidase, partial [candidate division WOR-3 bacterium]